MSKIYNINPDIYENYNVADAIKVGIATSGNNIITRYFFQNDGNVTVIAENIATGAIFKETAKYSSLDKAVTEVEKLLNNLSKTSNWLKVLNIVSWSS